MQPKECQQTLQKSFTIGGVGLHSGDYAVVKVKPAFAGEGRYFVRVPPGTNADDFTPEKPSFVSHERLDLNNVADDDIEAEERAEMFLKFLQEQEDGYEGEFDGEHINSIIKIQINATSFISRWYWSYSADLTMMLQTMLQKTMLISVSTFCLKLT